METNSLDIGMIGNGVDDNTDVTNMNQDEQILLQKQVRLQSDWDGFNLKTPVFCLKKGGICIDKP